MQAFTYVGHGATGFESGSPNRTFLYCVLASMCVHIAVLVLYPGWRQTPAAPSGTPVLTARIARADPPPQEAPRPREERQVERPAAPVKPVVEVPRPLLTLPDNAPVTPATPRVAEQPPVPPPTQPAAPASVAPPSVPIVAPASPVAQAPVGPAGPPRAAAKSDQTDGGNLARFRVEVLAKARKITDKTYPQIAIERGWTGWVDLRVTIGVKGEIKRVDITSSSGYGVLDRHAVAKIKEASETTPVPPALIGAEHSFSASLVYNMTTGNQN